MTSSGRGDALPPPSPFLTDHLADLEGLVLDLACGRGRNALVVAARGLPVLGLDRNPAFLADLTERARIAGLPVGAARTDLETPHGIPVRSGGCGAILVFRFLFRPLASEIVRALRPGGLLLYETFTLHQREFGTGPKSEAFLLGDGELPSLFPELEIVEHWEGVVEERAEAVARLAARRR